MAPGSDKGKKWRAVQGWTARACLDFFSRSGETGEGPPGAGAMLRWRDAIGRRCLDAAAFVAALRAAGVACSCNAAGLRFLSAALPGSVFECLGGVAPSLLTWPSPGTAQEDLARLFAFDDSPEDAMIDFFEASEALAIVWDGGAARVACDADWLKSLGVFYTPRAVADRVMEAAFVGAHFCSDCPGAPARRTEPAPWAGRIPRLLDPAAGAGRFLVAALRRAVADESGASGDPGRVAKGSLFGVDVNPYAVRFARTVLYLTITRLRSRRGAADPLADLPDLSGNIVCGDPLVAPDELGDLFGSGASGALDVALAVDRVDAVDVVNGVDASQLRNKGAGASRPRIHAKTCSEMQDETPLLPCSPHFATGSVDAVGAVDMLDTVGGFDIVVANPPYRFGERLDPALMAAYRRLYCCAQEQFDTYGLFLERAVTRWLRPGGRYAFLVPDAILVREQTARLRRLLVEEGGIESCQHLGDVFEIAGSTNKARKVGVSVALITGSRASFLPSRRLRRVEDGQPWPAPQTALGDGAGAGAGAGGLSHKQIMADPFARFLIYLSEEDTARYEALAASGRTVRDLLAPGGIGRGEETGKKHLSGCPTPVCAIPVVAGEAIAPFRIGPSRHYIERLTPRKRHLYEWSPKLMVVKTGRRLVAARDDAQLPCLQSVYCLRPKDEESARILEAWLNSDDCAWLVEKTITAYKKLMPQITQQELLFLPVGSSYIQPNGGLPSGSAGVSPASLTGGNLP